jgi:hypothetical protein
MQGKATLSKIDTADGAGFIPVDLMDNLPFAETKGDELHINADIISLSFIMLSRYEEKMIDERDSLGRFESKNSIAVKYNFIDYPVVDEYALILRKYLQIFFPDQHFTIPRCKIIPTHDIDEIRRFTGLKKTIRTILGDIIFYKNLPMFFKSIGQYLGSVNNSDKDPYIDAIRELVKVSGKHHLKSEFYFMGAEPGQFDCGYDIAAPYLSDILSNINRHGMTIGYHGGFETCDNSDLFSKEKERIETVVGHKIANVRQHYLRFDIHLTFRMMELCGMKYDSTLGYADREGFRCGTCFEYHPYDFENDKPYNSIKERPLIVMDVTLSDYRKHTMNEAYRQMVKLYSRCKVVGGNFVILWHNNSVVREAKWFEKVYCRFLEEFTKI